MTRYVCRTCHAHHEITLARWRCDCGSPLDLDFVSAPLEPDAFANTLATVTLGEGPARLTDDELRGTAVRFALEYVSPTGSFKDRGAAVLVSLAAALGASRVVDDSSGNAGIALAAYAARAGIRARVVVPENAAAAKLRIAAGLGAEVVRVAGGRSAAAAAAADEAAAGAFYASHAWSPFFLHGAKTFAYALAESSGGSAPGAVILPVGNGGLLLGLDLGFREMRHQGLVDHGPALIAVQSARCAPIAIAFEAGLASPFPAAEEDTAADGVRVSSPPRGAEVLAAVRDSGGFAATVSEDEIEQARRILWSKGYVVESTAALGAALVLREGASLRSRFGDLVVVLTGSGLKS